MKRSDVVNIIAKNLNYFTKLSLPERQNISCDILNELEKIGMLPPLAVMELKKNGEVVGIDTGHYWESENV